MKTQYYRNSETGELKMISNNLKPLYNLAVFIYGPDEDMNNLKDQCPLVYHNINDLMKNMSKTYIRQLLKNDFTIVIRPMEILDEI